jgi:hypothetical protein
MASLIEEGAKYGFARLGPHTLAVGTRDPVGNILRNRKNREPFDIEGEPPEQDYARWADLFADEMLKG